MDFQCVECGTEYEITQGQQRPKLSAGYEVARITLAVAHASAQIAQGVCEDLLTLIYDKGVRTLSEENEEWPVDQTIDPSSIGQGFSK